MRHVFVVVAVLATFGLGVAVGLSARPSPPPIVAPTERYAAALTTLEYTLRINEVCLARLQRIRQQQDRFFGVIRE